MGRYLLFAGDKYYPLGGWQDYKDSFGNVTAALKEAASWSYDWWQIVDSRTFTILEEGVKKDG